MLCYPMFDLFDFSCGTGCESTKRRGRRSKNRNPEFRRIEKLPVLPRIGEYFFINVSRVRILKMQQAPPILELH